MKRTVAWMVAVIAILLVSGCSDKALYTVGGMVDGLSDTITLQNSTTRHKIGVNGKNTVVKAKDTLTLTEDGNFTFVRALGYETDYNVTITAQPAGQTCTVTNGTGTIRLASVSDVMVACVDNGENQVPTAHAGADQSVTEGAAVTLDGSSSSDPDGTITAYVWTEGGATLGTASTLSYTFPVGEHTVTLTVTDNDDATAADTVLVTVTATPPPANIAPVANAQSKNTNEDTATAITLTGSDADGDTLSYAVVSNPAHGTLTGTAPDLTYTPKANYHGSDSFTFKVNDGTVDSAVATVSITVASINDAPTAEAQNVDTDEDTAVDITLAGDDVDEDTLSYTVVSNPAHGTLTGTAPDLTYTPKANYHGSDSFTFKVNDGTVDSAAATVTIAVASVNDAPTANPQSKSIEENTPVAITLTGNDIDGDTLSYVIDTLPLHGELSGTAPNVTYTPETDYVGDDSFTFVANDGTEDSTPATVTVTMKRSHGTLSAEVKDLNGTITLDTNLTHNGVSTILSKDLSESGGTAQDTLADNVEMNTSYEVTITTHPNEQVCKFTTSSSGTINTTTHDPKVKLSCKDLSVLPSTTPFVIRVKPSLRNGEYIYTVWKRNLMDYLYNVDCDNDGNNEGANITGDFKCVYDSDAEQEVSIIGNYPSIHGHYNDCSNGGPNHLVSVLHWGDQHWLTMEGAFSGCKDLSIEATDTPDLSHVTSMARMFHDATSFNDDISDWNVSHVQNMYKMFSGWGVKTTFNQPLNDWNVSNVTNMQEMFRFSSFNQPLDAWDTGNVDTTKSMFSKAADFNQSIQGWNVSKVQDMTGMFRSAKSFNQPLGNWDVSHVTTMTAMFYDAADFNQSIGDWNVSSVTSMANMFHGAKSFDQDINDWDVSNVTNMYSVFDGAKAFNHPLDHWDVSHVTSMGQMFQVAENFDQDIGDWNVSSVTVMDGMFQGNQAFNQNINDWNISSVTRTREMFRNAKKFNQPLDQWDVGRIEDMAKMFSGATDFNQSLSDWNVSSVTNMNYMFNGATNFEQNLSTWDVGKVTFHNSFATGSKIIEEPHWP